MTCRITGKCISCGACMIECPAAAINVTEDMKYFINPDRCNLCGGHYSIPRCVNICPVDDAIKIIPSYSRINDAPIIKDKLLL